MTELFQSKNNVPNFQKCFKICSNSKINHFQFLQHFLSSSLSISIDVSFLCHLIRSSMSISISNVRHHLMRLCLTTLIGEQKSQGKLLACHHFFRKLWYKKSGLFTLVGWECDTQLRHYCLIENLDWLNWSLANMNCSNIGNLKLKLLSEHKLLAQS